MRRRSEVRCRGADPGAGADTGAGAGAGERGFIGGAEGAIFGVLVFVLGSLVIGNAWGVIDASFAASAAAREASRAYVEAGNGTEADAAARRAASETMIGHGRKGPVTLAYPDGRPFDRCAPVTIEIAYQVPVVAIPLLGSIPGGITVHARHRERVDPYRSRRGGGAAAVASCA